MTRLTSVSAVLAVGFGLSLSAAQAETRLIMLGTGTLVPDATRSGPKLAVIHGGEAYLFDAGGGMVQRAIEAWQSQGVDELYPTKPICSCLIYIATIRSTILSWQRPTGGVATSSSRPRSTTSSGSRTARLRSVGIPPRPLPPQSEWQNQNGRF